MMTISVWGNENNRWKRDAKKQGETELIMKGWELNAFAVHLSHVFPNYFVELSQI